MSHTLQWLIVRSLAMHVDLLCACWYSWAVKGSSSLSLCCLLISLRFTSCLLLSPKLTDAPYSDPGARPPHPLSRWRLHSQDPRTLLSQGTRHLYVIPVICYSLLMLGLLMRRIVVRVESPGPKVEKTPASFQHYDGVLPSRKVKLGLAHLHTHRKSEEKFCNHRTYSTGAVRV